MSKENQSAGPSPELRGVAKTIAISIVVLFGITWAVASRDSERKPSARSPAPAPATSSALPEIGRQYMTASSCFGSARFEDRKDTEKALKDPEGFPAAVMSGRLLGVEKSELVRVIDTRTDGIFDTVWVNVRRMNEPSITLWLQHDCLMK